MNLRSYYVNELGPKFYYNMSRKIFIVNNIFIWIIFFKLFCQQWNLREEISQYFVLAKLEGLRNGAFATNSNFLIPFSFKPDGINLWYFKLWLIVWNIKDLQHWVAYEYGDFSFELVAKTHFLYATLLIRLCHLTDHLVFTHRSMRKSDLFGNILLIRLCHLTDHLVFTHKTMRK